jgi:hypothetical protein
MIISVVASSSIPHDGILYRSTNYFFQFHANSEGSFFKYRQKFPFSLWHALWTVLRAQSRTLKNVPLEGRTIIFFLSHDLMTEKFG